MWLHQVHGSAVLDADCSVASGEPEADAAITRQSGVVLAVLTADCLPVLFCTADAGKIAIAHAGWRGLAGGVLEATVAALDADPAEVLAWFGPAIGAASYEIGEEVRQAFIDADADAASAFTATRHGHWLCDLDSLARRRLAAVGVTRVCGGRYAPGSTLPFLPRNPHRSLCQPDLAHCRLIDSVTTYRSASPATA
jgi:hypothetical protein